MDNSPKKLNQRQEEAVKHGGGPLLVVAGAGTGKTTIMIERLASLIKGKQANPDEILIMTFTEKATAEMIERADKLMPYGYFDLWINTFHGFCERILREHALDIGLPGNFKLLDQTGQWMLVRKNLDEFKLEYYRPLGNPTKFIHELLRHFSRLKDENISAKDYLQYAEELQLDFDAAFSGKKIKKSKNKNQNDPLGSRASEGNESGTGNLRDEMEAKRINELANAYHAYNQLLLDNGFLDFGDLICFALKLFGERPNILEYYRKKFKYIMVDEFQDTNWAQYELVKRLAAPADNLMVTGDDDQAIYKFRGASLSNILQFKDDYPGASETVLTDNYRSAGEILEVAYNFIQHNNPNRLESRLKISKRLKSMRKEKGLVRHLAFDAERQETEGVADKIIEIYNAGGSKWTDFAILVRANDTADKFKDELTRRGVPNRFVSARGLYLKPAIIDVISYLKLLDNYHESSALFRVLNMENFKVGHHDIININKFARKKAWSLFEALENIGAIQGVSPEAVRNIAKLLALVRKHSELAKRESPAKLLVKFVYDSELLSGLDHDKDYEIYDQLNQFYGKIKELEANIKDLRVKELVEVIAMEEESGETGQLKADMSDAETVKIMTVHSAKGLEFKYVFLVNLTDKKFPTISRSEKIAIPDALVREKLPEGDVHTEEERRLFYVALTRARDALFLTSARDYGGAREKKLSKFVWEAGFGREEPIKPAKGLSGIEKAFRDEEYAKPACKIRYALPQKFSFSQIEAYSNCPLQYKYSYILKIPIPEKPTFVFGRVMHDTLRDFLLPLVAGTGRQAELFGNPGVKPGSESGASLGAPLLKENLVRIFQKNWQPDGYRNKTEREKYEKKGRDILEMFYDNLERNGWPDVKFLEKNFTVMIRGHLFRGAIDRVDGLADGTVEIIDYKTGSPKEKLDYSDKKQLILYKIALEQIASVRADKLSFYYLENGVKLSFAAGDKDLAKLENDYAAIIGEIQECNFAPKPGFLCGYCDFSGICEFKKI